MNKFIPVLALFALSACSDEKVTTDSVVSALRSTGVEINDVKDLPKNTDNSPLPKSYKERFSFSVPDIAPKGGQAFICEDKKMCDPLFAYFDKFKAFGGPHFYQSPKGVVVLQLNESMPYEKAKKLEKALEQF